VPYEYVEDVTSDITFRASGATLDELFAAAVDATTAAMLPALASLQQRERRDVSFEAEALDLLLLRVLDELIFLKDSEGLLLRTEAVQVDDRDRCCRAQVTFAGERIDRRRHELAADVKAATLYGLRVEQTNGRWLAQVTLDV
jgi:SHS2 domain-containing protein